MRKVTALLLGFLAISLFVSLGFVQSAYASPGDKPRKLYYNVFMPTGEAESNIDWVKYSYPMYWWGDPERPPFPPEEYMINQFYVCYGDWCVGSPGKEGSFRYQWWIIWRSYEAAGEPGAKSLGGLFIFNDGSGEFEGMWACGKAWVEMLPGQYYPFGYQYHKGLMHGGPQ